MSNWISTSLVIKGDNEKLKELKLFLFEMFEDSKFENDFGQTWLGHLAYNYYKKKGMTEEEAKENTLYYKDLFSCRGYLMASNIELNLELFDNDVEGELSFSTETKGGSSAHLFELVLQQAGFTDCKLYWLIISDNFDWMETNDIESVVFKDERYYIDHEGDDAAVELVEEPSFYSEKDAKSVFEKIITSSYIDEDIRLTEKEAKSLNAEELFSRLEDVEFYDKDDNYFYFVVRKVDLEA